MKRESFPTSVGNAVAELSAESRAALGWLRELGPLDTKNLALALDTPPGAVFVICRRLQSDGLVMSRSRTWALSQIAAAWADQRDRDAPPAPSGASEDRNYEEPAS